MQHIDEILFHFRKKLHTDQERYKEVAIFDNLWSGRFNDAQLESLYSGRLLFQDDWTDYLDGLAPGHFGKECYDVKRFYATFNIPERHWFALEIDITQKQINVHDCRLDLYSDSEIEQFLGAMATMLPMFFHSCDRMAKLVEDIGEPFKIHRVRDAPQDPVR